MGFLLDRFGSSGSPWLGMLPGMLLCGRRGSRGVLYVPVLLAAITARKEVLTVMPGGWMRTPGRPVATSLSTKRPNPVKGFRGGRTSHGCPLVFTIIASSLPLVGKAPPHCSAFQTRS